MITYVNTVLISNLAAGTVLSAAPAAASDIDTPSADAGKWVVVTMDEAKAASDSTSTFPYLTSTNAGYYNTMRIGIVTNKNAVQVNPSTGATTYNPVVKWSNTITVDSIKNVASQDYQADTEDKVYIDFNSLTDIVGSSNAAPAGKRIIVRLTFKDLPTRFRKWTESYEYVTEEGDTKAKIAENITKMINKEYKRARVVATQGNITTSSGAFSSFTSSASGTGIQLEAMKYTDDNSVNSLNWYAKVRFNANIYWTNPAAEGWESLNKNFPSGAAIYKVPGKTYVASSKLVRDREATAMGYQGILNHGEGTWPIIQPEMQTVLANKYSVTTIEFERLYRTADDLQRRTKEAIELYGVYTPASGSGQSAVAASSALDSLRAIVTAFIA